MTRDPVVGRGTRAIDAIRRLDPGTILALILVLGLVLRVLIAGILLPQSGLANDIGAFTAWAQRLAAVGPGEFYAADYFADYPPGYLYVLWVLGIVGGALEPLVGVDATSGLVKIPGILADIGVAWMLFVIARQWAPALVDRARFRVGAETLGLAAATVYLFSPGVIFDSAVWGQIDSVGTLVLLGTLYALGRGWTEAAAFGAILAMLVKFQFAFLIPVVILVGLKRHLVGRSSDPAHAGKRDPLRVLTSLAVGVTALVVLMLPFGMSLFAPSTTPGGAGCLGLPPADATTSLIGKFCEASNTYTGLTVNAFNLWRNPISTLGDGLGFWGDDTQLAFAIGATAVTWQAVGAFLFAIVAALALLAIARRDDMRGLLIGALVLAIAFFVLPTRVHERYLFPALALAAPLLLAGRSWPWISGGLALSFFANIYWVYTEDWSFVQGTVTNPGVDGLPMAQSGLLTATLLTDWGIWALSFGSVLLLTIVAWHAIRHALAPVRGEQGPPVPERPPADPVARRAAAERPPSVTGGGSGWGWLAPNPGDVLLREPSRRLDRRDALILVALVLFALLFRLWRLDVPRSQHFDEVYHGRSATEFLSSWQEGWDRDVYEWTHPMLAKYLIAGGMVLANPNSVVGESPTATPSTALAIAPARAAWGWDRSTSFTVENGTTIVARDAETGEEVTRWEAAGPVAALAYDAEGPRLLVGRTDSGTIETFEVAALIASDPGAAAPPAGPPIETGIEGVSEIVVTDGTTGPLLIRGPEAIAVVERETDAVRVTADGRYGGIGLVTGVAEGDVPAVDSVAVTDLERGAIVMLDATTLEVRLDEDDAELGVLDVTVPLVGPFATRGDGGDQLLFALTGQLPATEDHPATAGGIAAVDSDEERLIGLVPLPGAPTHVGHQDVAGIVYVAGTEPDGTPAIWTAEPHVESRGDGTIGLGAFDTTTLPGTATAMAFDVTTTSQDDDHERLVVSTAATDGSGELVVVDAGSNAFAWRVAGIGFGAALVGLIYLLGATMFGRRRIAILAAAFVAIDGMSYVMSRIAMNDIFVACFIVAAYLLFWQVWSGRWRRSAWWAMPLVGVLIGLAASTKWVGFYAMAGLLIMVLARSALGRLILVGLAALVTVIGGIGAPWPFAVVMIGILGLALTITWIRPLRIDAFEALTAIPATLVVLAGVAIPFVLAFDSIPEEGRREPGSAVEYLFGLLARGAEAGWPAFIMLGVGAVLLAWRAWASLRTPGSDARWWQPGELGGFAWSWAGVCLVVIPLTVYALSYVPYLQMGHDWAIAGGPNYSWSLEEMHAQMFGYHFNLQAGHPSSSPWWSWPLALKPTWFYSGSFDNDQIAVIYNGGNPVLFWAGIPALVACAVLAWKRRSMALVLLVAAFAFQLVPWIRIERASFAYHYLTAVLFAMVAVAYVVDELLRRPAWRELAIGFLALVAVAWVLVFPLGSALAMPDWYVNAARALPPWNFGFQFPDPPSGDRGELVSADGLKAGIGLLVALAAGAWALLGRSTWERRARREPPVDALPEGG